MTRLVNQAAGDDMPEPWMDTQTEPRSESTPPVWRWIIRVASCIAIAVGLVLLWIARRGVS